jgi:hypothetical protein
MASLDVYFDDEHTPLPAIPGVRHDPEFPTGHIPRIRLAEPGEVAPDAVSLYPRWRLESACANAAEFAELFTPHFEGTRLWLFPTNPPPAHDRVALEIVTRDGDRALVGIADVIEFTGTGPYGRLAIRVRFLSIDLSSSPRVLDMTSNGQLLRSLVDQDAARTQQIFALPRTDATSKSTQIMFKLPRDNGTTRMSRLELANMMGATFDQLEGWDERLACAIREIPATGEIVEVDETVEVDQHCDLLEVDDLPAPLGMPAPFLDDPELDRIPRMTLIPRWLAIALIPSAVLAGLELIALLTC